MNNDTAATQAIHTISFADQIRASKSMYDKAFENIEGMSDADLRYLFVSDATAGRILTNVSGATADRILANVSGATADRILANVSGATAGRILTNVSSETAGRILANVSDATAGRILANVSDATAGRILANVSDATAGRILANVSDATAGRILANVSDATAGRILTNVSGATADRIKELLNLQIPIIAELDLRVLAMVDAGRLDMSSWHCKTTHCRAGWAITFGGEAGAKLESVVGPEAAGRLIYEASTGRPAPDFYASNEDAVADIRRCAGVAE